MVFKLDQAVYEHMSHVTGKNVAGFITGVKRTLVIRGQILDAENHAAADSTLKVDLYIKRNFMKESRYSSSAITADGKFECSFEWTAKPLDNSKFIAIFKLCKGSMVLAKEKLSFEAHRYPQFGYLDFVWQPIKFLKD